MKIVIAVHHFPPRFTSGAEGYAYRLAKEMRAKGHDIEVVCVEKVDAGPAEGVAWKDELYDDIPVHLMSFDLTAVPDRIRWEYDNPWIGSHISTWLQEKRPDLIHVISGYLLSASVLRAAQELGIPIILTLMDYWFLCPRITMLRNDNSISTLPIRLRECAQCLGEEKRRFRIPGRLFPHIMTTYWGTQTKRIHQLEARWSRLQESLGRANIIISHSKFLRKMYLDSGILPQEKDVMHLPTGRDFPHLTPALIAKKPSATIRLGYLGQISWHKGVHIFVEALRQIPEGTYAARIYGNTAIFPDYTSRLKDLIGSKKSIHLAGVYHSPEELTTALSELDIVIVPSLWYENCPYVILEAFAHHTPVIASNLGGMAELVQHEKNGLLFKPGDAGDLARQIRRLLDEPKLLDQLREGIGPVKSIAQEMNELESIYFQLASSPN